MPQDDTIVIERLARVETKIDFIIERDQKTAAQLDDHDQRLSKLEVLVKVGGSILAVLLFVVTFFQDWINALLVG